MLKKIPWNLYISLNWVGALFSGILCVSFMTLAIYLAYYEVSVTGSFRVKFLMMPMMNVLIASVLFYYTKKLSSTALASQRAKGKGSFAPPQIRVTLYDMIGFVGFTLVAAVVIIWFF